MPNSWTEFIKKKAKELNIPYACALSMPEVSKEYKEIKQTKTTLQENRKTAAFLNGRIKNLNNKINQLSYRAHGQKEKPIDKVEEKRLKDELNKTKESLKQIYNDISKLENTNKSNVKMPTLNIDEELKNIKELKKQIEKDDIEVENIVKEISKTKSKPVVKKEKVNIDDLKLYFSDEKIPLKKYYIEVFKGGKSEILVFDTEEEQIDKFKELAEQFFKMDFGDTFIYKTNKEVIPKLKEKIGLLSELLNLIENQNMKHEKWLKEFKKDEQEFYKFLEIPESATKQEVNKIYRKNSLKLHPDKNPDPKAHDLFKKLANIKEKIDVEDDFYESFNKIIELKQWYSMVLNNTKKIFNKFNDVPRAVNLIKKTGLSPDEAQKQVLKLFEKYDEEKAKKNPDNEKLKKIKNEITQLEKIANIIEEDDEDENYLDFKDIEKKIKTLSKEQLIKLAKEKLYITINNKDKIDSIRKIVLLNLDKTNPSLKTLTKLGEYIDKFFF